jgi:serine/threonine protein kinase
MDGNATAQAPDTARAQARGPARLLSPGTYVADKYLICDVLGTGGAAVVYAAEQLGLKRVVAFKLYPFGGVVARRLLERFEREAQLLARVHHENVVAVFDSGSMPDGSPYLVVQRLLGESLASRLLSGPLPLAEALDFTHQLLNALSALSDAGIAHRDIKPGNVVLDRSGEGRTLLKLVDFGIAKELGGEAPTVLEELIGTPNYMAPEQVRGEPVDERSDLYALGATLYEMLTGRPPHTGKTEHDITRAALFAPITPVRALRPDCPEGLERIVMKALARDRDDRYECARAMKRALEHWQASHLCEAHQGKQPSAHARALSADDTLRIPTAESLARRRYSGRGRPRLGLVIGLAVLGGMFSRELVRRSQESPSSAALAPSSLALTTRVSAQANAAGVQARVSLAQLLSQARASADQLLAHALRLAPGWRSEDKGMGQSGD